MGLLASTTALSLYLCDNIQNVNMETLQKYAFTDIGHEEQALGWTNIHDMFDTTWRLAPPTAGEWLCFSLRVDTRKVPSALLKKHLAKVLLKEEEAAASRGEKVTRKRKKELKEQMFATLRSQTEALPTAIDVAVNIQDGHTLVATTSEAQLALVEEYFTQSFGTTLQRWAWDETDAQRILRSIYGEGIALSVGEHHWHMAYGEQAVLAHPESNATVTAKGEQDTIDNALNAGFVIHRLQCVLTRDDDTTLEWTYAFDVKNGISGLKIPKTENTAAQADNEESLEGLVLEKLYLLEQATHVLQKVMAG